MFTIDPSITAIPLQGKNLFKALFSMNTHQVATPEMGLADARSYVFFFREGNKRLSAYIGIYLLHADRKLFYPYSGNPFLENELGNVEEEARIFVEDLGAMLDEIDCARMSDLEKDHWIEEQGILSRPPAPETQPEAQPVPAPQPEAIQAPPVQQVLTPPPMPQVTPTPQAAPAPPLPVPAAPQAVPVSAVPSQAPAVQPVAEPQQPQVVQPTETAAPVAALPEASRAEQPALQPQVSPYPQPRNASAAPLAAAEEERQKITQKAVKAGIIKAPQPAPKQETASPAPTGVVSRDREALARLLTSF